MAKKIAELDDIIEELNKGKSIYDTAEKFGYKRGESISGRIIDNGYKLRKKLSQANQNQQFILNLNRDDIEQTGHNPDQQLYYDKEVENGKIVITPQTDRVKEDL